MAFPSTNARAEEVEKGRPDLRSPTSHFGRHRQLPTSEGQVDVWTCGHQKAQTGNACVNTALRPVQKIHSVPSAKHTTSRPTCRALSTHTPTPTPTYTPLLPPATSPPPASNHSEAGHRDHLTRYVVVGCGLSCTRRRAPERRGIGHPCLHVKRLAEGATRAEVNQHHANAAHPRPGSGVHGSLRGGLMHWHATSPPATVFWDAHVID